jgi:hypothetical protein
MFKFAKHTLTAGIIGAVVGIPSVALADCNGSTQVCSGVIETLYASPDDNLVYIDPQGSNTSGFACTFTAGKYLIMALDTDTKRATWQLLLGAFLAGKSVNIRTGGTNSCKVSYVTVEP